MLYKLFKLDWLLISAVTLLSGVSLLILYSLSTATSSDAENFFQKQFMFAGIGFVLMFFMAFVNYHYLRSYARAIFFLSAVLLGAVLVFGAVVRGTMGWLNLGFVNIQPVEISKVAMVIILASFFSKKKGELGDVAKIIASLVLSGVLIYLVIRQPDFGSAVILAGIWFFMLVFSGINKKYVLIIISLGVVVSILGWFFLAAYQKERIINFLSPERDPMGTGYNVIQSIVAVGSGGMLGKGIGQGTQSQLNFLPEKHTDFIFAVIAEEAGVFGVGFVLMLFAVLFYRIKIIADRSADNFGYLLAIGTMAMIFFQVLINVGMNLGVMPVTGIPLPFLSYGGSSLVSIYISIGILLSVCIQRDSYARF